MNIKITNMKTTLTNCLALGVMLFMISSCQDDIDRTLVHYTDEDYDLLTARLDLPSQLYEYGVDEGSFINTGFGNSNTFITGNERKNHIATLGRVLFYDEQLSINNTVSCASCHEQSLAFADNEMRSEGFEGQLSLRNSLPLGNTVGFEVAYGGGTFSQPRAAFGWDEANRNVTTQTEAAITSTLEMGMHDMSQLAAKLAPIDYYQVLFRKAFGSNAVTEHGILDALDEFVNSISSNRSKFDKAAMQGGSDFVNVFVPFSDFTTAENNGKAIYLANCANCHSADHSLTAVATANNGLDLVYEDQGVGGHTGFDWEMGVFKVPFLRNVALTHPYMHDGRFTTLEEVVDFYSEGIQPHENLHPELTNFGTAKKFNFSDREKSDLIAYLHTLTDEELLTEAKWSDPFKK